MQEGVIMRRLSCGAIATTGRTIRSANAGTTNSYVNMISCSMATPHVSGVAATVMEHYP
jgi:subtilisin family serine protease